MNKNCSIVVSSCDNFSDVWDPFFTLFFRYWPDCPFKIYLMSGGKIYRDNRVSMIRLGEDKKYASNLKSALQKIDTPYVIYFHEDYLLKSKVDTKKILCLLNVLIENNAAYLKLFPSPMPRKRFKQYKDIGEIEKGRKYSISHQAAIWNKSILESLLIGGETGWDMEINGGPRTEKMKEPFLSVYKAVLDYPKATGIKKGVWLYDAVRLCEKEGIEIKSERKIETRMKYFLRQIDRKGLVSIVKRRLFLMGSIILNLPRVMRKAGQFKIFYKMRKSLMADYNTVDKKDISRFVTEHWRKLNERYEKHLRDKGMRLGFLRDEIIGYTMFNSSGGAVMDAEIKFLENRFKRNQLKKYLEEDVVGLPIISSRKYSTSHNSIHQLYHLARFLYKTGTNLDSINTVVEWGGGYGCLAKIFFRMEKQLANKTYVVIDTPLFSCIQRLYLSSVLGEEKINLVKSEEDVIEKGKINVVPLGLADKINVRADLFVSTWALSESSAFSQNYVLDKNFFSAKHILIAYQKSDSSLPDSERINSIIDTKIKNVVNEPINFLPGNNYLFK